MNGEIGARMSATSSDRIVAGRQREERAQSEIRAARRHSRLVRALRLFVPVFAVVMAVAFGAFAWLTTPSQVAVSLLGSGFSDGRLVMANPRIEGYTRDNLPYTMRAARAIQDVSNASVIELEEIDARLPVNENAWADIDARRGLFHKNDNRLDISEDMVVTTTDGLVARLKTARIDIGSGAISTDDPVDISREGTHIVADSMSVTDNGKVYVFENRVRVAIATASQGGLKATGRADAKN